MKTLSASFHSLLASLLIVQLQAAPVDVPLVFPEGVGVNIHFTRGHESDLNLMRDAGFKFIRMDFGWGGIERKKGEYDWSAYDELTANLEKRGMRAIYILDYSNALYEEMIRSVNPLTGKEQRDIASPAKLESIAAFARWAGAAAEHFEGRRIIWEIWNEPNISFWKPKPNVNDYTALVLATCKAVRAADPHATIVAPATSEFPWTFIEDLFKAGVLEQLDAVSVHPYRSYSRGPETAGADFLRLRVLIERYAPAGKKVMPILSGEWGYASHAKGVTLDTQAAFIARQQIANVWSGVPISIWYDWKNDGTDPGYNEHNFGTVSNQLALKPSYNAVKTMTAELRGHSVVRRLSATHEDDYVLLLENRAGDQKLAAWTAGKPRRSRVRVSAGDVVKVVDGQGKPLTASVADGNLSLDLDAAPQFVTFVKPSPALKAASAWTFESFVPTLVDAGAQSRVAIPVQIRNPFRKAARVRVDSTSGIPFSEGFERTLAPGETVRHTFTARPQIRTSASIDYTISAKFESVTASGRGEVIGSSSERRQFFIANPLALTVAPKGAMLRLIVDNPAEAPFSGSAVVNDIATPIQIARGKRQVTVESPMPAAGRVLVRLVDANGGPVTETLNARFIALRPPSLETALDGDAKVAGSVLLVETNAPMPEAPLPRVHRLDYSFDAGWKFVRAHSQTTAIEGGPRALGMWIHGDESGNALRVRVTDRSGQTFQPTGPNLDWSGWRWVEFDLKDMSHAGHWGGANDGIVHGPLKLDTLLLVDGSQKKTAGTIHFGGAMLVY
jgi:polysaccharide biosynthesis protein PslG